MIRVEYGCIPRGVTAAALRVINLDLFSGAYDGETIKRWTEDHHWLPHLWRHPDILRLVSYLPAQWCVGSPQPAQIVVQPPYYGPNQEPYWHVDEGEWRTIVGIPLTPWNEHNGTLYLRETGPMGLQPGDAVMMSGDTEHGVGKNHGAAVRYGVYFRWK